jgi:hypothetical protein
MLFQNFKKKSEKNLDVDNVVFSQHAKFELKIPCMLSYKKGKSGIHRSE